MQQHELQQQSQHESQQEQPQPHYSHTRQNIDSLVIDIPPVKRPIIIDLTFGYKGCAYGVKVSSSSTLHQVFDAWKFQMANPICKQEISSFVFVFGTLVLHPSKELVTKYMQTKSFIQVLDSVRLLPCVINDKPLANGKWKKRKHHHRNTHSPTPPASVNTNSQSITGTYVNVLHNTVRKSRFGRKLEKSTRFQLSLW
jgi:hypothetical protein